MYKHKNLRNKTLVTPEGNIKFDAKGIAHDLTDKTKAILDKNIDVQEIKEKKDLTPNKVNKKEDTPKTKVATKKSDKPKTKSPEKKNKVTKSKK